MTAALIAWGRGMNDHRDGFHPFMGILMMLLVAAAGAAIVWLFASRRPHHVPPAPHHGPGAPVAPGAHIASPTANAEAILAERLARGEISSEEYTGVLATLRGTTSA